MIRFCVILSSWVDRRDQRILFRASIAVAGTLLLLGIVHPAPLIVRTGGKKNIQSYERKFVGNGTGIAQKNIGKISKRKLVTSVENCVLSSIRSSLNLAAPIAGIENIQSLWISTICTIKNTTSVECATRDFQENPSYERLKSAKLFVQIATVIGHG